MAVFRTMVLRGPDIERDGVSSWTAKDLCLLVERRFGARYHENGMLKLLHSLGLFWQKTRPSHPRADPKAQAALKKNVKSMIEDIAASHPRRVGSKSGFKMKRELVRPTEPVYASGVSRLF